MIDAKTELMDRVNDFLANGILPGLDYRFGFYRNRVDGQCVYISVTHDSGVPLTYFVALTQYREVIADCFRMSKPYGYLPLVLTEHDAATIRDMFDLLGDEEPENTLARNSHYDI